MRKALFFVICGIVIGYYFFGKKEESKTDFKPLNQYTEIVEVKNGALTKVEDNIAVDNNQNLQKQDVSNDKTKEDSINKTKAKYKQAVNEYNQYKTEAMSLWQQVRYYKNKISKILK
ncbi:MAG: hypothetical protein RL208_760 [Pseudomonadota bacterium]|jgi:hypothetical protein